jgi:hypothetical protein
MKAWNKAYDEGKKRERNEERTPDKVRNKD